MNKYIILLMIMWSNLIMAYADEPVYSPEDAQKLVFELREIQQLLSKENYLSDEEKMYFSQVEDRLYELSKDQKHRYIPEKIRVMITAASRDKEIYSKLTRTIGVVMYSVVDFNALHRSYIDGDYILPNNTIGYDYVDGEISNEFKSFGIEYNNLLRLFAIFDSDSEFYLVTDLDDEKGRIFNQHSYSDMIELVAPSLDEHIEDLILGLEKGIYLIDYHMNRPFPFYPLNWEDRQKIQSGKYRCVFDPETSECRVMPVN